MTKTYTMPTWGEFIAIAEKQGWKPGSRRPTEAITNLIGDTQWFIIEPTYNAIREALAVEQPEAERLVGKARGDGVVFAGSGTVDFTEERTNPATVGEIVRVCRKSGQVMKAVETGQALAFCDCDMDQCEVAEKAEPVADRPRCLNCACSLKEGREWGFVLRCRRMPPVVVAHRQSEHPQVMADHWCGEWRAK